MKLARIGTLIALIGITLGSLIVAPTPAQAWGHAWARSSAMHHRFYHRRHWHHRRVWRNGHWVNIRVLI